MLKYLLASTKKSYYRYYCSASIMYVCYHWQVNLPGGLQCLSLCMYLPQMIVTDCIRGEANAVGRVRLFVLIF